MSLGKRQGAPRCASTLAALWRFGLLVGACPKPLFLLVGGTGFEPVTPAV